MSQSLVVVLLLVFGVALLVFGGEVMLRGAVGLAKSLKLSPAIIGVTVVAAGTSMPELVVSLGAALDGHTEVALGNVVGSNIFNTTAIIGVCALATTLTTTRISTRYDMMVMLASGAILILLVLNGELSFINGFVLLALQIAFYLGALRFLRQSKDTDTSDSDFEDASFGRSGGLAVFFNVTALLLGTGLLIAGAKMFLNGSVIVARAVGLSEAVIALTIVSVGTSLPELFASFVAALRGQSSIAIGNVVGSNIFNTCGILGITAMVRGIPIYDSMLSRDLLVMMLGYMILIGLSFFKFQVGKVGGLILLSIYLGYTYVLLL